MKNNEKNKQLLAITVLWFRRDFRLTNNPAFNIASSQAGRVLPIYIENSDPNMIWRPGGASRWWCHHSLQSLSDKLKERGMNLKYFRGDPGKLIPAIMRESGADTICWNRLYEPNELMLEEKIEEQLTEISVHKFDSQLLFTPGTVLNQQQQPYRVFTPFWRKARVKLDVEGVDLSVNKRRKKINGYNKKLKEECRLDELALLDKNNWHIKLNQYWVPGENAALKIARRFKRHHISGYEIQRDIPSVHGTSKLSAHLHFGEITASQLIYSLLMQSWPSSAAASVERFITELGWREFSQHTLWHFPFTTNRAMNERFINFWPKKPKQKLLKAWQTGNTGVPIIDAGMRELWQTGWMHNRVRMIVASFLTKNLGIHWLHGARWFWNTLVDADLASNTLGWQWVAGCGVDAAPYYRIFNPYTQVSKFDKELKYIKSWLPEYNETDFTPIVDVKKSRDAALELYKIKNGRR